VERVHNHCCVENSGTGSRGIGLGMECCARGSGSLSVRGRDKRETRVSLGATETEWEDTERGGSWRCKRDALSISFVD